MIYYIYAMYIINNTYFNQYYLEELCLLLCLLIHCLTYKGNLVEKDFNIRREAGNQSYIPVQRNYTTQVTENSLEIHLFWAGKGTCCIPWQGTYGPSISTLSIRPCKLVLT